MFRTCIDSAIKKHTSISTHGNLHFKNRHFTAVDQNICHLYGFNIGICRLACTTIQGNIFWLQQYYMTRSIDAKGHLASTFYLGFLKTKQNKLTETPWYKKKFPTLQSKSASLGRALSWHCIKFNILMINFSRRGRLKTRSLCRTAPG